MSRVGGLLAVALVFFMGLHSGAVALASVQLEKMEVEGTKGFPDGVVFTFSGELKKDQVQMEFASDSVSLLIEDALIYPSKMLQTSGENLKKVFAYQFSPKQVRCKLTLKGKPESYKSNFDLRVEGRTLSLGFGPAQGGHEEDREERQLLERVTHSNAHPVPAAQMEAVPPAKLDSLKVGAANEKEKPGLGVGRHVPSFQGGLVRLLTGLLLLVGIGGAAQFFLKKKGINLFKKITSGGAHQWIEVIGSHSIGPRKSVMLVKISGRTLALGVTEHSIQTLSDFSSGAHADAGFSSREFDDALLHEASKPSFKVTEESGVRGRIRSRVEGLKPL